GEIVHVTDSSDPNWWKGYNDRGEGLFPANFVTEELAVGAPAAAADEPPAELAATGADEADGIDEAALDEALALLHEADPACAGSAGED
ncbi:SH3 domain-containing protein, partial [Klebsiella pneumoniae]|nr:SH3 domain-containing protein [Klebsiella pneumoniae]